MTNEVSTELFGGAVGVKSSANLAGALRKSAQNNPRGGSGDGDFMNFSGKRGILSTGKDNRVVGPDELFVINIAAFEDGFICWKGGKPVDTRLARMDQAPIPAPDYAEHGPFGDGEGWSVCKSMTLKSLDEGTQHYFKINSVSGTSVFADLIDSIADRAERGDAAWPVVTFSSEEFSAQGYKNFKPQIDIEGWLDDENVARLAEEDADLDELLEASGSPSGGKAEPKAVEAEEKPARSRRRRA